MAETAPGSSGNPGVVFVWLIERPTWTAPCGVNEAEETVSADRVGDGERGGLDTGFI